jgi:hypothetical protein
MALRPGHARQPHGGCSTLQHALEHPAERASTALTCGPTLLLKLKKLSNAMQPGRSVLQAAAISAGVTSSRVLLVPSTKAL